MRRSVKSRGRRRLFLDRGGDRIRHFVHLDDPAAGFLHGADHRPGDLLDLPDDPADLLGGLACLGGEILDLAGDDGEAFAGLAGPCRLDRGVQRQQVGLAGDILRSGAPPPRSGRPLATGRKWRSWSGAGFHGRSGRYRWRLPPGHRFRRWMPSTGPPPPRPARHCSAPGLRRRHVLRPGADQFRRGRHALGIAVHIAGALRQGCTDCVISRSTGPPSRPGRGGGCYPIPSR